MAIEALPLAGFWSAATILLYLLARAIHRRWPRGFLAPIMVTPCLLILAALALHTSYRDYSAGTRWMLAMLGPVTVAFAIPIHEHRALIRRHWRALMAGAVMGSATSMLTAWALAALLGLDGAIRLSLLPRSISTPFAVTVSGDIGGLPDMTAVFVVATGLSGALLGDTLLRVLPLRSSLARGALFGVGAHGIGVARAHGLGREEGSVAGVVMILAGVLNVLAAPILAYGLR